MEQKLAARLSERQVAEFVEVHSGQMLGDTTLLSVTGLDLQRRLPMARCVSPVLA
jgi:hypothetical protein